MSDELLAEPATRPADADTEATARRGPAARTLLRLGRNQPGRYLVSWVMWVSMWVMPLALGVISQGYFDRLAGDGGWPLVAVVVALLAWLGVRLVGIFVAMRWHARLMFRAGATMQRNMLRWILGLPGARSVRRPSGEVVSRFRDDVEHTVDAFDLTVDFSGSVIASTVSFVLLAAIDPVLATAAFAPMAVVLVAVTSLSHRIRAHRRAARDTTEGVTGFLGEAFGAAQAIKLAGSERSVLARFARLNDRRRAAMVRDRTLTAATEALGHNTGNIGIGIVLLLGAASLSRTSTTGLSVGEFALFANLLHHAAFSAYFVGFFLAHLRQAGVSVERMVGLMDGGDWTDLAAHSALETPLPDPAPRAVTPRPEAPLLEVRGLSHLHDGTTQGIRDVDLVVERGQLVVVTGRVGAGKTTLLRTVLGLLPADAGEIRWQGRPVTDPATFMVPPRAAYTPQVPRLFSMSLRDNLLLGHDASAPELEAAVHAATLTRDVAAMPDGFATRVGTRGLRLSGGQVQRSAAARMLVRSPELLVFDDLSSALDVETEAALWEQLFRRDATTALVVSHRRPALQRADQVVVLEHGRVVARGTAARLRATSPVFRELWG